MELLLGIIIGFLVTQLILLVLIYFRRVIEQRVKVVSQKIENAGPKPRGFIVEPPTESDEAREKIIQKNKRQGRDTKISELL